MSYHESVETLQQSLWLVCIHTCELSWISRNITTKSNWFVFMLVSYHESVETLQQSLWLVCIHTSELSWISRNITYRNCSKEFNGKNCIQISLRKSYQYECWFLLTHFISEAIIIMYSINQYTGFPYGMTVNGDLHSISKRNDLMFFAKSSIFDRL